MIDSPTLIEFIFHEQSNFPHSSGDLSQIVASISLAAKIVHSKINGAGSLDLSGGTGETNVQGEDQQKLDLYANERFKSALAVRGHVCGMLSEEEEAFTAFSDANNPISKYVVALDPIDGSSNIDVNVPVGTIFSIYKRISDPGESVTEADFLQVGRKQIAAGYIIYGPATMFVYTTGNGVYGFTYDPAIGEFFLTHPYLSFPEKGKIFSVNDGHSSRFSQGVRDYITFCKEENKEQGRPYTSRYVGSLVSDFHRNLLKGGIYLYPGLEGSPDGKLRLLYECNPLAFIAAQAGGVATNGVADILDIEPTSLHQRSPLFFGPKSMMDELKPYLDR